MTRPADYRVPLTRTRGHLYVSANSLAWGVVRSGQGNTVALGPGRAAGNQGHTIDLIPPEPVAVDPDSTVVMATAAVPRILTVDELERELRRPARQDPPIYADLLTTVGIPVYVPVYDGDTTAWAAGALEVAASA